MSDFFSSESVGTSWNTKSWSYSGANVRRRIIVLNIASWNGKNFHFMMKFRADFVHAWPNIQN